MDKIVKTLFLLSLFVASCSKKTNYDENTNNIKFVIEKYITIDFKKEKISLHYHGLKYEDTVVFTKSEKKKIISFFNENNFNDKKGEFWYIDENSVSASLHDEIVIFKNNKIMSRFIINSNYNLDNSYFQNEEVKVVRYKEFLKSYKK